MKGTIRVTVKVAGFQRERRFTKGTPARVLKAWREDMRAKLRKRHPQPERTGGSGTLARDAERYYPLIKVLADWVSRRSEIRAWLPQLGERFRHTITAADVQRIRGQWKQEGRAAKTINNRVTALRDLYKKLDGDDSPTPCDGIRPMTPARHAIQVVSPSMVNRVLANLERSARKHARQDRARLMVLASTGKRPVEVERAQPGDVDLARRIWLTRDAKGGWSPGCYLNNEMLAAWQAFVEADAWGPFPGHFPRRLRDAGWPPGIRPYNLRHSTWIEASERGNDLCDIQAGAGHRNISTTRRHYVPVLKSRMQRLSESLEGRFGWKLTAEDKIA